MDLFKELIPSIMKNKRNLADQDDGTFTKSYVPYVVNKALSQHIDTVLYANEMNRRPFLDKKLQYDFLLNSVRAKYRPFEKWHKKDKPEILEVVKQYYQISDTKAREAMKILSDADIEEIIRKTDKGGVKNVDDGRYDRSEVEGEG